MAVDSKLIQEVNEKRFNPWLKVSSRSQDGWIKEGLDPSLSLDIPDIPGITKIRITDSEVWLGIDIGHSPDPTSVAVVKHLRLTSTYREGRNSQEFITSFYRIVRCKEWSGVSYPDSFKRFSVKSSIITNRFQLFAMERVSVKPSVKTGKAGSRDTINSSP